MTARVSKGRGGGGVEYWSLFFGGGREVGRFGGGDVEDLPDGRNQNITRVPVSLRKV